MEKIKKQCNKNLENKIINTIMNSGNKNTGEKLLIKSLKRIQKTTKKNHIKLIKQAIIQSTPTFKINQQVLKRGKRKTVKENPIFIKKESLRITLSLKFIISASLKKKDLLQFYKKFTNEILSEFSKSKSIENKNEVHKQILMKKRYFHKFRW